MEVNQRIINSVQHWLESVVIDLNLCPFAKRELLNERVRFVTSEAITEKQLLVDLAEELELLDRDASVETTLLVHPQVLQDFDDYNQFLNAVDALLEQRGLLGIYQVASFHPQYQFGGTEPEDAENYTNRSPYPMLHILREESLEQAIDSYPGTAEIPERNIELMREKGGDAMRALLKDCF